MDDNHKHISEGTKFDDEDERTLEDLIKVLGSAVCRCVLHTETSSNFEDAIALELKKEDELERDKDNLKKQNLLLTLSDNMLLDSSLNSMFEQGERAKRASLEEDEHTAESH